VSLLKVVDLFFLAMSLNASALFIHIWYILLTRYLFWINLKHGFSP
jgi:hypothetical protein